MSKKRHKRDKKKNSNTRDKVPSREELLRQLGHMGTRIGRTSEARVYKAFRRPHIPYWIIGIRKATREEDSEKKDFFFMTTDVGEIPLQVKSSQNAKNNFLRSKGSENIPVIVIDGDETDRGIQRKVMREIARERARRLGSK